MRRSARPGTAVSTFLGQTGANIISLDQYSTEQVDGIFIQRTIFHLPGLTALRDGLEHNFSEQVASRFGIDFWLTEAANPKRVAIMASREDRCLLDLWWRNRRGDLDMSVVMVVCNHPDLAEQVRPFGVRFVHVPISREDRDEAERRQAGRGDRALRHRETRWRADHRTRRRTRRPSPHC